jgi:hypothetical protein
MRGLLTFVAITLLMCAMTDVNAFAQGTAQISGTVRDQSGAVLPGVEVTATQTDTAIMRTAVTNETGSFILPNLAIGPYRFEAALPGFRSFAQTGIVLQVNSNPVINPVLEVGQVSEQVEVQANATLVETRGTAIGQVIENERILELPLNGRQVTDLITLSGAAVQTATANHGTWQEGVLISIAGGQSFGVMYSLDGAMHNDPYQGAQMAMPFPDALQEFKVEASGFSAAGGTRGSGGQVNAVTKSGTNEFHGNLFEFVRNYKFNARNFFAPERDTLKRNQFGGTLGGPIAKNKLFFFGGYQNTKTRSDPDTSIGYVPTAAMLAGDFTAFASPACNAGRQIPLRSPFVGTRLDPSLYSKAALNIAARLPKAQDECGTVIYGLGDKPDEMKAVGKVDYQMTAKHSIFGRYLAATLYEPPPYDFSHNLLASTGDGFDNLAQSYAIGSTYLIGPNTVNSFRIAVNRVAVRRLGIATFGPTDVGIKGFSSAKDNTNITVSGGFTMGQSSGSGTFRSTGYQIGDDLSIITGNHQLTFGGNLAHSRTTIRSHQGSIGTYTFNGNASGLGMSDFLLGALTTLNQGSPISWSSRQSYIGAYVADVWKVVPKLTFNYGLRWEPFLPLFLTEGAVYNYNEERFQKRIRSTVFPNGPAGFYFPGDPGFPEKGATNPDWLTLAPRVGLAWDLRGDGHTSVRASYGIAYDFSGSATLGGSASAPPVGFVTTIQSPGGGFEDPWRDFPGGMPFPWVFNPKAARFTPFSTFYSMASFDMRPPAVQSWNLSVQRQIPADFLVSTSYLGSQSTHLWVMGNVNRAVFFPGAPVNGVCTVGNYVLQATGAACSTTGNTNQRRRLYLDNPQEGQYVSNLATREDTGTAQYHGLLISVQRRAATGINVGGNYTLSHCIGNAADANANSPGAAGYLDPNNRNFDRGNCDSDRRHILNLTGVVDTPQFAQPALRRIATGWRVAGIYRKSSGRWLTVTSGLDRALSGASANQRPNQILESPYGDRDSLTSYLNPSAFAQPASGTLGNIGKFNILSPGTWQLDVALSRIFAVRENQKLEVRAEAFNVTNSLIKRDPPGTNLNSSNTFGVINSSADARILQFALKYAF